MENSLVTEAGLLNEELLEYEVEVAGRCNAPTVASAFSFSFLFIFPVIITQPWQDIDICLTIIVIL